MIGLAALGACEPADDGSDTFENPCAVPGNVCTWAGLPGIGLLSEDGLFRTESGFYWPHDIVFMPSGEAYVPDFNNHRIRRIGTDGIVTTVSGSGWLGDGPPGVDNCWYGCDLGLSDWWHPAQISLDPRFPDVLWVASWHNHRVVRIDLVGQRMEWYAGAGEAGARDGDPEQVLMSFPSSVVVADDGTEYVSDQGNHTIRKITPDGTVETIAGLAGEPGYAGDGGPAVLARLRTNDLWVGAPAAHLLLDGHRLFVNDTLNSIIRVIDLDTGVIDRFAGTFQSSGYGLEYNELTGQPYNGEYEGLAGYAGDGGDALDAEFAWPRDLAKGPSGDLFVADSSNHCVRRIDRDGFVSTVAGVCGELGFSGDEGPATEANFHLPVGVEVDADGNLYIADANNHVIRRVARDW
jgi:DNA-binding beta-propeller fold protein YncE